MRAEECSRELALKVLRPVLQPKANPAGWGEEVALDGRSFAAYDNGKLLGVYVLRGVGTECWIQAAAGRADIDLCDLFDELVKLHAEDFESIGFCTHRRGLVAKATERGYHVVGSDQVHGTTLRKILKGN